MKKLLLPPFLFILCIILMFFTKKVIPSSPIFSSYSYLIGWVLVSVGLWMILHTLFIYKRVKTEINTFKSPTKLITNGLFRYSRNPIYLGFTTALVGVMFFTNVWSSVVYVLVFVGVSQWYYIPFEENQLQKKFGKTYLDYKANVRRWF